jgi:hypothetical protein
MENDKRELIERLNKAAKKVAARNQRIALQVKAPTQPQLN